MKIESLRKLAEQKNLILTKTQGNMYVRQVPIYSKTKGETIKGTFFGDIVGYKKIYYRRPYYLCRTRTMPEYQNHKITKADFLELTAILNK